MEVPAQLLLDLLKLVLSLPGFPGWCPTLASRTFPVWKEALLLLLLGGRGRAFLAPAAAGGLGGWGPSHYLGTKQEVHASTGGQGQGGGGGEERRQNQLAGPLPGSHGQPQLPG